MGEVAARNVGWRVGLGPRNNVQNFKSQLRQAAGYGEDVVIRSAHPDGAVLLQFVAAGGQPGAIEGIDAFGRASLVPFALVHTHHLAALHADAAVGQEIGRVGKYHVELELKLFQKFDTITVQEGEGAVGGTEEGGNFRGWVRANSHYFFLAERSKIDTKKI